MLRVVAERERRPRPRWYAGRGQSCGRVLEICAAVGGRARRDDGGGPVVWRRGVPSRRGQLRGPMVGAFAGRRCPAAVRPLRRDRRRRGPGPVLRVHGPADLRECRRGRRRSTAVADQAPRADGRPAERGTAGRERRDRATAATGTSEDIQRFPTGVPRTLGWPELESRVPWNRFKYKPTVHILHSFKGKRLIRQYNAFGYNYN